MLLSTRLVSSVPCFDSLISRTDLCLSLTYCSVYLGYPCGHLLGKSCPLGFHLCCFYFSPVLIVGSLSRLVFRAETAGPIEAKFHMEFPWDGGTKVYSKGPGHMIKMAAMPTYGKNLKKSSSPEPKG